MLTTLISRLLPNVTAVRLDSVDDDAGRIMLTMTMVSATGLCPQCHQPSSKVHSRYLRTLADLPWATLPVQLRLTVRKFFCRNPAYSRRIFAERPPSLVVPFARRTNGLRLEQQQLALTHGGEASVRTVRRLKMPLSPDTLLRLARRAVLPPPPVPQIIGVDEWFYRRGQAYGTSETVERLLARHQQALHTVTCPRRTATAATPTDALTELEANNPAPQSMMRAEQRQ